ncbi:hypothetical protein TrVE_jg11875 [Triparma verrucosa]|uniref:BAR domain-containing protein n=2 Tax=Triparma TaxID=722752 RepID=A0A9W7C3F0_9STRA|nr:hypothetical protein TrVE_jg11875 [Triparma verrucosa]GMI02060.1 hypothetical protein TrST_g8789 [Triparma strigata]
MQAFKEQLKKGKKKVEKYGRRQAEKVLQKLGAHTSSSNPEVDEKVNKVSELDGQLQELYDGVSEYLIAVSVMQAASTRVAQTFSKITDSQDPQLKAIMEEFLKKNQNIEEWTHEAIHQTCMEMIVRPTGEKLNEIPELTNKLTLRDQKLLDYDAYRSRFSAETAKNADSEQTLKLASKVDRARESLEMITSDVLGKCQNIQERSPEMISAAFSSFVACQVIMNARSTENIEPLLQKLPLSAEAICMICKNSHEDLLT